MTWKLQEDAYHDWKDETTDEFVAAQQEAFLAGFETAAEEGEEFWLLREWLKEQRDQADVKYQQTEDLDWLGRKIAFTEVLTKLSAMGVRGDPDE